MCAIVFHLLFLLGETEAVIKGAKAVEGREKSNLFGFELFLELLVHVLAKNNKIVCTEIGYIVTPRPEGSISFMCFW